MTAVDERAADASGSDAPEIGKARRRKEDHRLITGRTRYTDNPSRRTSGGVSSTRLSTTRDRRAG